MKSTKNTELEKWTETSAKVILPILIELAKNGKTITYGKLDELIVKYNLCHHVMAVAYGKPAGFIGNALIELESTWDTIIPPINALIVNNKTKLPSHGIDWYIERYTKNSNRDLSKSDKAAIIHEVHSDIFSFTDWDLILEELELSKFEGDLEFEENDSEIKNPPKGGWSNEPESEDHRMLKDYVSKNPHVIGLDYEPHDAKIEYLFPSSDRADIVFTANDKRDAVEIKSRVSNINDITKGIFQCVKYQALLRAEQKAEQLPPTARSFLVIETSIPQDVINLAKQLNITIKKVIMK